MGGCEGERKVRTSGRKKSNNAPVHSLSLCVCPSKVRRPDEKATQNDGGRAGGATREIAGAIVRPPGYFSETITFLSLLAAYAFAFFPARAHFFRCAGVREREISGPTFVARAD